MDAAALSDSLTPPSLRPCVESKEVKIWSALHPLASFVDQSCSVLFPPGEVARWRGNPTTGADVIISLCFLGFFYTEGRVGCRIWRRHYKWPSFLISTSNDCAILKKTCSRRYDITPRPLNRLFVVLVWPCWSQYKKCFLLLLDSRVYIWQTGLFVVSDSRALVNVFTVKKIRNLE